MNAYHHEAAFMARETGDEPATVAAVIVTYQRPDDVVSTVRSVQGQSVPVARLIVVDNSPEKEATAALEGTIAEVLGPGRNLGFSGALALGIQEATRTGPYDYYWLMDDDSPVGEESLALALSELHRLPRDASLANRGARLHWTGIEHVEASGQPIQVDLALVDGTLVSRAAVERVGTPRPDLFMVFEDFDFTSRIRHAGLPIYISSAVTSMPKHLGSSGPSSAWRAYYQTRNHLRSAIDLRDPKLLSSGLARLGKQLAYLQLTRDSRRRELSRLRLQGLADAIRGRMGRTIDPSTFTAS